MIYYYPNGEYTFMLLNLVKDKIIEAPFIKLQRMRYGAVQRRKDMQFGHHLIKKIIQNVMSRDDYKKTVVHEKLRITIFIMNITS
jgi:hypothetical protein